MTRLIYLNPILHEETLREVRQAMETLSVEERSLLRLKYEDGLTIDEIAHP